MAFRIDWNAGLGATGYGAQLPVGLSRRYRNPDALTGAWVVTTPGSVPDVWIFLADGSDFTVDTDEGCGVQSGTHAQLQ